MKSYKRNELTMITIPKPNFAETNVPIRKFRSDYKDEILGIQGHWLKDAIDRVSLRYFIRENGSLTLRNFIRENGSLTLRNFIRENGSSKISSNVCKYFKWNIWNISNIWWLTVGFKVATSSRFYIMRSASLFSRLQSISVPWPNFEAYLNFFK